MKTTKEVNVGADVVAEIKEHLSTPGNVVQLSTYLASTVYSNPEQFRATDKGAWVRNGRRWCLFATPTQILLAVRFAKYV